MTANFPVRYVLISSRHHTEDRDVQFPPFKFQSLGKGHHEEQEEDGHHVVPLADSHGLRDLCSFVFNCQYACVVTVNCFNGSCEFWWGAILAEDVNQQHMISCVVRFDQIYKAYVQGKVVVVPGVEECF